MWLVATYPCHSVPLTVLIPLLKFKLIAVIQNQPPRIDLNTPGFLLLAHRNEVVL